MNSWKLRLILMGIILSALASIFMVVKGVSTPIIVLLAIGIVLLVIGLIWKPRGKPVAESKPERS
ncbi:MAG TPA: hypothetical protein VKM55_27165 [Candidatus Lokiarchaeia archaeon]|nr:hypothetical protein [Candidatus Lokiarchaeia archaeon]